MDYNATTPVDPRVANLALHYMTGDFGNPSSDHSFASNPRVAVAQARRQLGTLIGINRGLDGQRDRGLIVFTGSGSEANLLALRGAVLAPGSRRTHIVTQATEHPAILATCAALARNHSVRVTVLPVGNDGLVEPVRLAQLLARPESADTAGDRTLVSIMAANNETGALQPVSQLAEIAHAHGGLMHSDAAQAPGKISLDIEALGVDMLTIVGHKMYAPKGVAALYLRDGLQLEPVIYGGGQEYGLRAGTENVALIAALGEAARLASADLGDGIDARLTWLRDRLHLGLARELPGRVQLNGPRELRLPNTLNISIAGVTSHQILDVGAVAASSGAACHSGTDEPSPVLTAMGASPDRALGALRFSLGRWTTEDDVDFALDHIARAAHS